MSDFSEKKSADVVDVKWESFCFEEKKKHLLDVFKFLQKTHKDIGVVIEKLKTCELNLCKAIQLSNENVTFQHFDGFKTTVCIIVCVMLFYGGRLRHGFWVNNIENSFKECILYLSYFLDQDCYEEYQELFGFHDLYNFKSQVCVLLKTL